MQSQSLAWVVGRVAVAHKAGYVCTLLMLVTGCATFDQRAGFSDVSTAVEARSGKRVVWHLGTELDAQVDQEVRALLQDTLTVDGAVQVALLNNRNLQALYAELGVAQADLVQAGLLRNPVFDGAGALSRSQVARWKWSCTWHWIFWISSTSRCGSAWRRRGLKRPNCK